jgi:hypothetical protein
MWWKHQGAPELRELLMQWWDPIGVRGVPEARGEYDSYMGPIVSLLERGGSIDELASYLVEIETDRMGMKPDKKTDLDAASRIHAWYREATGRPKST